MSPVAERLSTAVERLIGTSNASAVSLPFTIDQMDAETEQQELSIEEWAPLFEPGFGSASTIVSSAVTIGTAIGTMRVNRESASQGASGQARSRWNRLSTLADTLEAEGSHLSKVRALAKSRNFRELEEAGSGATVVALNRLRGECRPLWLFFLQHSTGARPAEGQESIDGAANAWVAWGFRKGLL